LDQFFQAAGFFNGKITIVFSLSPGPNPFLSPVLVDLQIQFIEGFVVNKKREPFTGKKQSFFKPKERIYLSELNFFQFNFYSPPENGHLLGP